MWIIDVQHDFDWVNQLHQIKKMPSASIKAILNFKSTPKFNGYIKLFGNENGPKLLRIVLPCITTYEEAQEFIAQKLSNIINHIELSITLTSNATFRFKSPFNGPPNIKCLTHGAMEEDELPLIITESIEHPPFDYYKLKQVLTGHFFDLDKYSELLQSAMNTSLKIEYRWLDVYKLFEMHFGEQNDLNSRNEKWVNFLERFKTELTPHLRNGQNLTGLLTQIRNAAAHYAVAKGNQRNSKTQTELMNKAQETFPIIAKMLATIINEHPENLTFKLVTNI